MSNPKKNEQMPGADNEHIATGFDELAEKRRLAAAAAKQQQNDQPASKPAFGPGAEIIDLSGLDLPSYERAKAAARRRREEALAKAGSATTSVQQPGPCSDQANGREATPSLDFLDDFFGGAKRHLVAIRKNNGKKPDIKARHFDASDRIGQQKFIADCSAANFDLYFSPNPIKGTLHKKATKNDVAETRHLWIDLDPRPDKPLETERTDMLALLTTAFAAMRAET
jgi:hypothetical protein